MVVNKDNGDLGPQLTFNGLLLISVLLGNVVDHTQ